MGASGSDAPAHGVTVTLLQDVILPEACLSSDGWPASFLPPAGCSQALALVQMVDDPEDLLRGREMGPALSETAARAAARHLERRISASEEERSAGGEFEEIPTLPSAPVNRKAGY